VFSDSIEEHEKHLKIVFQILRDNHLFLNKEKCFLYVVRIECLGHIINEARIHIGTDKMESIRNWRTPRNVNEVQRFLGLVQYIAQFMSDLSAYTGPLSSLCSETQTFHWRPLHDKCLEMIKVLACKTPILKPIDLMTGEPIWLVCNASVSGVGAMYGQGADWRMCRPAGFMSQKFTAAQFSYKTWDHEALAILEEFLRWEDKLLGRKVSMVTDHEALGFFKTQQCLTSQQTQWMEFLEHFDYTIKYIQGQENKVADCLSRYFQSDWPDKKHPACDYVNADVRLDSEGDDLPSGRIKEVRALQAGKESDKSGPLKEIAESRGTEAEQLRRPRGIEGVGAASDALDLSLNDALKTSMAKSSKPHIEGDSGLLKSIHEGYEMDKLFRKVMESPSDFGGFTVRNGFLYSKSRMENEVLCIPRTMHGKRRIPEILISEAHEVLGHFGSHKMAEYVRCEYWWPTMSADIVKFCATCGMCQVV
jgi:hypothetical protein